MKKTRQNKNLEPRTDSIGTEKALVYRTAEKRLSNEFDDTIG
jgi:hypothetical protein